MARADVGARDAALAHWEALARQLQWTDAWTRVHEVVHGRERWFADGRTNLCANAVDRHADVAPDALALLWEGEPGDRRSISFGELRREVCVVADALLAMDVGAGDIVAIYAGLVPETVITMLACARIGAVHAVLPSVLPAEALSDRLQDLRPRVLLTQDGAWRHGVMLPLKIRADEAVSAASSVDHTIVIRRTGADVAWFEGDRWYHELVSPRSGQRVVDAAPAPRPMPADAPLLITYLANRNGRPSGVVHDTGGVMTYCYGMHIECVAPGHAQLVWAPMEIGWIALQTHGILGPLLAGATAVLYEGMLDTPHHGRAWDIIARYGVTSLVATASVLRALRHWPDAPPRPSQVASLQRIISAGEPIEAGMVDWLRAEVGRGVAPVLDAWGQTELGGAVTVAPDGGGGLPDAGLAIVDEWGAEVPLAEIGDLVLRHPWPGKALGLIDGRPLPGDAGDSSVYTTGDRARRGEGGAIEFLGRRDHVFSVSGQLVSEVEVREALEQHPFVARAEVVDRPDRRTGRAVAAAVELTADGRAAAMSDDGLATELAEHIRETLGGLAAPKSLVVVEHFPRELGREDIRAALQRAVATAGPVLRVDAVTLLSHSRHAGGGPR